MRNSLQVLIQGRQFHHKNYGVYFSLKKYFKGAKKKMQPIVKVQNPKRISTVSEWQF